MNTDASSFLQPLARVDANNRLEQDLICNQCGYNLRGLRANGICVECTRPVIDSVLRPGGPRLRPRARFALQGAMLSWLFLGSSFAVADTLQLPIRFGLTACAVVLAAFSVVTSMVCLEGIRRTRRVEWLAVIIAFLLAATVNFISIDFGSAALNSGMSGGNCTCD